MPEDTRLTEEERREWWERQRRKFVWGPGDLVWLGKYGRKEPEGEDDEDGAGNVGVYSRI